MTPGTAPLENAARCRQASGKAAADADGLYQAARRRLNEKPKNIAAAIASWVRIDCRVGKMPSIDSRGAAASGAMSMITVPNQSSVAMAYKEFDENVRMRPSSYYDRIVDVMEELVRFTILTRPHAAQLVDRYSERKARGGLADPASMAASASGAVAAARSTT